LGRAITAVLVTLSPVAALEACQGSGAKGMGGGGGGGGVSASGTDAADGGTSTGDGALVPDCATTAYIADATADGDPACAYVLPCGLVGGLMTEGCGVYIAGSAIGCDVVTDASCDGFTPEPGAPITIFCPMCLGGGGRRPRGLRRASPVRAPTPLGAYFAAMAHEEAASVHAFQRLHDELAAHGAPPALRRAAARAAADEERHARVMARRARGEGARVPAPRVRPGPVRAIEAIARENAVEGCVGETFGAFLLAWQAAHAGDASLRRTFARIAADEARHAAISWAVARWAEGRLDGAARDRIGRARTRAIRALRRRAVPAPFDAAAGLPGPAVRRRLLDGLVQELGLV
jgi:hypothetical protein